MKTLLGLLWTLAVATALGVVTGHTRALSLARQDVLEPPPLATLDTRILNVITLGHRPLWDDMAAIWLLQILMDQNAKSLDPQALAEVVQTTTRHLLQIESSYLIACLTIGLELKRPELCERFMLHGLEALPQSWRIPATQGFMYAFELDDQVNAALYYNLAASRPGAPAWFKRYGKKLADRSGLSLEELQGTIDSLLTAPGGSRLGDLLQSRRAAPIAPLEDTHDHP